MALLKNCEIWHLRADPKRPNPKFNPENPTWECQIRTTDKAQAKEWEAVGLSVKPVIPEEGKPYWRVNLKKKSIKADGEPASPVQIINGRGADVDPLTVGNASVANIRLYEYEYVKKATKEKGKAFVFMGLQLTKHIVYKAPVRTDDFDEVETEVIDNTDSDSTHDDDATPSGEPKKADTSGLY